MYYETFNNIINCIKDRFSQRDYQIYVHLHEILIKTFKKQDFGDDLQIVIENHAVNEFDGPSLKAQLLFLLETAKFYGLNSRMQLSEMIALFKKLDAIKRMLVAEVIKPVKLILIMSATKADSERSFLFLKRIKTYFCSTAANNWLNHPLILHSHKLLTDRLNLTKATGECVERREERKLKFGLC